MGRSLVWREIDLCRSQVQQPLELYFTCATAPLVKPCLTLHGDRGGGEDCKGGTKSLLSVCCWNAEDRRQQLNSAIPSFASRARRSAASWPLGRALSRVLACPGLPAPRGPPRA